VSDEIQNPKIDTGLDVVVAEEASIGLPEPAPSAESPAIVPRPTPTRVPLLLEVGCEEIPARFLRDAEKGLGERVQAALQAAGLLSSAGTVAGARAYREAPSQTFSTPRRLVVYVPAVLTQQADKIEEVLGPPLRVAVDSEGKYTRAAESFAQKNAAQVEDLARATTPKGDYLSLRKTTLGRPALEILAEILPGAIMGLTFPKSMYWTEKSGPRFVRPIRWILAILGEGKHAATVGFDILGVKSGNFTFGHRAKSVWPVTVKGLKDYTKKLAHELVEIDYKRRLARVVEGSLTVGESAGRIVQDVWLMDWIANSTEWPRPMLGSFDERFLHLAREILITVMRDHQRYFAVEDEHGNLRPHFVVVLNMESDAQGLIRQGHQRVLTARFRDAEFFWNADQKVPLRDRVALLDRVTYQARLGSYGDKIKRVKRIAEYACATLEQLGALSNGQIQHVMRAVELCKCDLTTQMVQEFTELQGVVGGLYAKVQGEPEEVSVAISDHYLPLGTEGGSPRTIVGAVVSLADKIDSVVAGFAAGYEPTGSSDPFALRRQANGIIKVILELSLNLNIGELVDRAIEVLEIEWRKSREEVRTKVLDFFAERLRHYFESVRGFCYDTVRAVVAAGAEKPADAQTRAEAMQALRGGADFEALSTAAKRIRNILAKSATAADWQAGEVVSELLTEPEEKELSALHERVAREVEGMRAAGNYRGALEQISSLRPAVDRFFDKVLVMAKEPELRQNRLRLLKKLDELFSGIAHFAEIEGQ
jgi:glycyl-tRNA synthetase beta chain